MSTKGKMKRKWALNIVGKYRLIDISVKTDILKYGPISFVNLESFYHDKIVTNSQALMSR